MKKIITFVIAACSMIPAAHAIKKDTTSNIGEGAYGVAFSGYSHNEVKFSKEVIAGTGQTTLNMGSLDFGAGVGYMGSLKRFLLGIEITAGYASGTKSTDDSMGKNKIDLARGLFGEVVGKLGFKFDRTGIYALGGFTRANFKVQTSDNKGKNIVQKGMFYQGPLFGGGIIYNALEKLSVRIEYRHIPFNTANIPVVRPGLCARATADATYLGIVYHV